MDYQDILYAAADGIATITINRAGCPQRGAPQDLRGTDARDDAGGEGPDRRRHRDDRRGRQGVLRRRRCPRPADARSGGRPRPHAAAVRAVVGDAHGRQADHCQGARLLCRQRQRDQPVLRHDDRERGRQVRPDRPARGQRADLGRVPVAGALRRRAQGARDALHLPPLHGAAGARDGPDQRGGARPRTSTPRSDRVCQEILDKSPQSIRIAKIALNAGSDQEFYGSYFPTAELLASIYGNDREHGRHHGVPGKAEARLPQVPRPRTKV